MLPMPVLLIRDAQVLWQDVMTGTSIVATPEAGF